MNIDDTKLGIFLRGKVTYYPTLIFGHSDIEIVTDYVYPGVEFHYIIVFNQRYG